MADLKSNTASAGSVRPPLDIPVARHRTLATRSAIIPNHNAAAVAAPPPQSLGSTSTVSHRDPRPRSHHHTPPRPRATTSPIGPPPRTGHGEVGRDLWLLRGLWWLHVRVLLPALRPLHDRRDDRPRRNGRKEVGASERVRQLPELLLQFVHLQPHRGFDRASCMPGQDMLLLRRGAAPPSPLDPNWPHSPHSSPRQISTS